MKEILRPTTLIESARLNAALGLDVVLASETFQHTGSFKFRAAYFVASRIPQQILIAASSGNFGQALAYACRLLGKQCTIVMPQDSARVKVDAVREHGGRVELVDTRRKTRKERVMELAAEMPEAYVASAYDDPLVIDGNATLGIELATCNKRFDCVVAPVGGGGLISGLIAGFRQSDVKMRIFGAEPLLGNDAARSLRAGHIVASETEVPTIADGARTSSIGTSNWALIREGVTSIVEVPEKTIIEGVRLLFSAANLKAEPTGGLAIGALLAAPEVFRELKVCCVISGGNVDPELYAQILREEIKT
jgi:threonine dehydratase